MEENEINEWIKEWNKIFLYQQKEGTKYNNMGVELHKTNKPLAISHFNAAHKQQPKNIIYLCNLAATLNNNKEFKLAIKYAKKAIKLEATSSSPYNILGTIYYGLKKYQKSLFYYQSAISLLKKNNVNNNNNIVNNNLNNVNNNVNFEIWESLYCNIGGVFVKLKNYEKAKKKIKKGISFRFSDFGCHYYGLVLYKLGKYNKSILNLEQSLLLNPFSDFKYKICFYLSRCLEKKLLNVKQINQQNNQLEDEIIGGEEINLKKRKFDQLNNEEKFDQPINQINNQIHENNDQIKENNDQDLIEKYEPIIKKLNESIDHEKEWSKSIYRRSLINYKLKYYEKAINDFHLTIKVQEKTAPCSQLSVRKIDEISNVFLVDCYHKLNNNNFNNFNNNNNNNNNNI